MVGDARDGSDARHGPELTSPKPNVAEVQMRKEKRKRYAEGRRYAGRRSSTAAAAAQLFDLLTGLRYCNKKATNKWQATVIFLRSSIQLR